MKRHRVMPGARSRSAHTTPRSEAAVEALRPEPADHDVDTLTGLPRWTILERQPRSWAARAVTGSTSLSAALFVDLDNFKYVNDSFGHKAGDAVLQETARRIVACTQDEIARMAQAHERARPTPVVTRVGGDSFAILIDGLPSAGTAHELAAAIQLAVARPMRAGDERLAMQCSIGIALQASRDVRTDDIVRDAGTAMHEAKRSGKGRRVGFRDAMHEAARRRLRLESDLRRAVASAQVDAVYQPIVNLETGRVASFEALARWHHPLLGPVPPDEFIPLAEETGLVVPLAHTLLCRAVDLLERINGLPGGGHVRMNVNVSRRQLSDPTFLPALTALVHSMSVAPERLTLEVTESVVIGSRESVRPAIVALKELGVQIHLDDFGTGLSSLSLLRTLPIDGIKVDRSFLDAAEDREAIAILHAIITLGRNLRKVITAEGLETTTHMATVLALECDLAQGFLLGRPIDAASATRLLLADFSPRVAVGRALTDDGHHSPRD
jgi:diguanylate cyclase (GGDEF)-like protein